MLRRQGNWALWGVGHGEALVSFSETGVGNVLNRNYMMGFRDDAEMTSFLHRALEGGLDWGHTEEEFKGLWESSWWTGP